MDKDPANINNYYYGMVFQNCDMSSATIQRPSTRPYRRGRRTHQTRNKEAS